jgi:4-hydroxyphenylpyruvate dioxygenase-like putative hemolysin
VNQARNGPQNVGRIDHIVFGYRSDENLRAAQMQFAETLGVSDWEDQGIVDRAGVRVVISRSSGLELLSVARPGSVLENQLATRGEGFYTLAFGVAELDQAAARAEKAGMKPVFLPPPPATTMETFEVARQAVLGDVGGISIILGEFVPKKPPQPDPRGREYVGSIHHVAFAHRDQTAQDTAIAQLTAVLGIDDWEDIGHLEAAGIHVKLSPRSGIELLCATRPGSAIEKLLATRGEGFMSLVLAVSDLDKGLAIAIAAGAKPTETKLPKPVVAHYEFVRQALLGEIGGVRISIGEYVPKR